MKEISRFKDHRVRQPSFTCALVPRREKEAKVDCTVSQAFRRRDNELIMGQGDPGLAR